MFSSCSSSIIKTLIYADLFDYPLTTREVQNYLIDEINVGSKVVQKYLRILTDSKWIYTDGEFYFLEGRNKIVELRKKREEWSKQKREIARRTVEKLKVIPTIKMVGITGALAMDNCKKEDDIDLLIVASRNSLWLTRLFLILSAPLLGINRRKPKDIDVNNKICFNLFLDEDHLKINPENLFLAHEIVQVKPSFDRGGVYEKFIRENKWVKNYLPNALQINKITTKQDNNLAKKGRIAILLSCYLAFVEKVAFHLQFWYMKPKMTIEKVNLYQAFFHPKDLSDKIQKEFERRILKF